MSILYIAISMINSLVLTVLLIVASGVVGNPILNSTATGIELLSKGLDDVDGNTTVTVNPHSGINNASLLERIVGVRSDLESIKDSTNKLKHREGRGVPCQLSPPGVDEPCVLCNGETYVIITDINGYECPCQACTPATFMVETCQCTADGQVKSGPTCDFPAVDVGYINVPNVCPKPYPCSECQGDLVRKPSSCSGAADSICVCPEDTYSSGVKSCTPLPLCSVNHERRLVQNIDSTYLAYDCLPCSGDTFQPHNNSAELCQPKAFTTPPQDDKCPTLPTPPKCECPTPAPSLENCTLQELSTAAVGQIYKECRSCGLWGLLVLLLPLGFVLGQYKNIWELMKKLWGILCQDTGQGTNDESLPMHVTRTSRKKTSSGGAKYKGKKTQGS